MPSRKDPASQVVAFFESASLETATVVFQIVKAIVARRTGATKVPRLRKGTKTATAEKVEA
jgi:hypothetical protein